MWLVSNVLDLRRGSGVEDLRSLQYHSYSNNDGGSSIGGFCSKILQEAKRQDGKVEMLQKEGWVTKL
jgi:hypothetical protein